MNAKIKLSLLALAGVSMLASCGAKGETLTRAQAETELNSYVGKAKTPTKFTYTKKTVAKKTGINSAVVDTENLYGYRHFDVAFGKTYEAGSTYYVYKSESGKFLFGAEVGSAKKYCEVTETAVKAALAAGVTALTTYTNGEAPSTAKWLAGFDKAEGWMEANSKDKTNKETYKDSAFGYAPGLAAGSVKGYIKSESYTKYADGSMKADILAVYPQNDKQVAMGGENCIYEWENYQLTRLYNNYQDYEETMDWNKADGAQKPIDLNTWTKDLTLEAEGLLVFASFGSSYAD